MTTITERHTESMSNPIHTRREWLRRTATTAIGPLISGYASTDSDRPGATDLVLQPDDIPWKFYPVVLPTDGLEGSFLRQLRQRDTDMADADVVLSRYASSEISENPAPPDVEAVVVVPHDGKPNVDVIDNIVQEYLDNRYGDPLARFDPVLTETESGGIKRWTSALSVRDSTLYDVYARQRVRETLFVTNARAYDAQCSAQTVTDEIQRRLSERRRSLAGR